MDVNDNAFIQNKRVALKTIASNRASTGCSYSNRHQARAGLMPAFESVSEQRIALLPRELLRLDQESRQRR